MKSASKLTASAILLVLGLAGSIYSAITYSNDISGVWYQYDYNLTNLTDHESFVVIFAAASILTVIIGVIGIIKNKEKD